MGDTRGNQTIARALDAALEVYTAGGLGGLSVQGIRQRSGVSVGSLYHHFGNREGIMLALYQRCLLALLDEIRDGALRARSAKGMVRAMIERYVDWVQANPNAARFILCAAPAELDPLASPELREAKRERVMPLIERAQRHATTGEITSLPPQYYELMIIGPVAETSRRWLLGEPIDLAEARTVLSRLAWRALAPVPRD